MKSNKLLHVLLMSGCLISCSDDDDPTNEKGPGAPDSSVADAALTNDGGTLEITDAAPTNDGGGFIIPQCGEAEIHLCSFVGPESGAEACELVREGMDLCCCWAPEVC